MNVLAALPVLALSSCITLSDVTLAPVPCVPVLFPVEPFDLNPRMPADGVCVRARIQEQAR